MVIKRDMDLYREEEEGSSMNRYKKDSYYWYKKVIETNGDEV